MALSDSRKKQRDQAKQNAKNKAEQQKKAQQTIKNNKSYTGNKVQQTVSGNKKPSPTKATNTSAYKGNAVQNTVFGGKNKVTNSNVKQADKVTGKTAKTAKASNYATGSTSTKSGSYAASSQGNMTPKASRGTGKTYDEKGERQKAIDKLNANSMAWHNTTDTAERARLHRANDAIRKHFGMTYNGDTGATYLPKAGGKTNVSEPVVRAAQNAPFNTNFKTQAERQAHYNELNSEIDRMQKQYPYLVAKDMQNRNLADKAAAAVSMLNTPRLIKAGIQGAQQYNNMSANNKKQADAMFQLYQRLNDEASAISKQSAGKAWGSGAANAVLNAAGAVENAARYVTSAGENALSGALKLAGAQNAGKFWEDTAKKTVNTSFSDAAMQKVNDWAQPVGMTKKAQELAGSGARMLPGMALNAATGGASKVSSLLDKAPLANASLAAIFGDSAASGTREALQDGANLNQALAYGAGSGLTEVGTEKMFGGIPGLNEGIAKLGSGNRVLDKAFDIFGEGIEEATSTLINPYLKRATYDKNAQNATAQELWDSAKGGMALAGIMQGANAVSERLANRRYGTTPENQAVTTPVDTQAQTQYTNTNGGVANGINGQQNGNGDFSAGLQGRPDGTAFDSAVPNRGSNDGRTNSGLSDGVLLTSQKTRQIMNERGLPNLGLKESTGDNASFSYALEQAKANNSHGAFVDSQSAEDLNTSGTRTFLSSDGMAGAAVRPDGDIVGVFKNSQNRTRQAVKDLLITALSNGGTKLDCYGNTLGKMYAQMGFVPVARMDFNPEYATNWKPEFGTPDVIFWMHNGDSPELVASKSGTYSDYSNEYIKSLPTFTDYDAAGQYRDMLLAQQQAGRTQNVNVQNPYDINPKLRTAAQTAQENAQSVQPEITQPMQGNAQTAAQTANTDINPKLTRAGENQTVTAESSVGAAETGFDPYSKMVNDYGAIEPGMNPARVIDVPQSTNGNDRVSNVARTIMESGITPDNLIPALENHVAEGLFSHDVKSLKKTLSGATKTIQKKGWQGAFDQWEEVTDGRRAVTDDDIALGQMMYTAAVEAGDTQTAMKLAGDLAVQGTALGRGVNAFKLLKKTTPEGQLYYLQKAVQKIQQEYQGRFDKRNSKNLKKELKRAGAADKAGNQTAIVSDTNAAIEQASKEVAEAAKSATEETAKSTSKDENRRTNKRDHGIEVKDWATETGHDLAKRIADRLNTKQTQRPITRTILSDLLKFADEHALPKKPQTQTRQAVDRLRDYFANKDFYTKAWNEAKNTLKEKYRGNQDALDALESFTDSTIDYNADPLHTQKVIMNALMDDIKDSGGLKTYLGRETLGAGEQNVTQLADRLVQETGVTGTDAEVLRSGIAHAYEEMTDGKSGTSLETMIRETLKSGNLNLTEVAKMNPKQKAVIGQTISGLLQKQYGIDAQYAETVSSTIIDEYNAEVKEHARKILENKFKERKQRVPREFWDVFEEYANLGTFNSEYAQKATEKLFGQQGITLNEDLVQEFLNAETQEARDAVVDKIYNDVAQQIPKTAGDIVNAWRYFAMLGNPRTHIRNIMGNVASAAALDASHAVSAIGQKFLPQAERTRALHTSREAKQFAKADYANVEAELSGNAYKTEMSEIKQRQKLFPKPLQKVMDANSWALDAEDQVFKKKSYIDSMGNFLTARGWDVNNLTEAQLNEARQHAIQDAKIATFQDASALADALGQLEKKNKATEVVIGSLVPFKRTPINVAKRSFELSPVGLLKAITYDAVQVHKGNMDATKMIDHIGQGLTGSSVAALGVFLAAQGIFSAGSSDDDKEANLDAGMGQQEYAINLFGKSYTIDWASPAVVPLAMGGELYEALHQKYDDEETAFNQAMATFSRMFDPLLNMTMLSGIGSTVTSAAYNKSNPLFGIASNIAINFGGQFVPTLFGQIARTVDNTRRTTYADKNSAVPSSLQKFLQRQANKIPVLSKNQPAYTDVWGREQKNGPDNVFARAAYNFFSPGYLADAKGTQAEKALKELFQATGDNSVLPSKPQKYYTADDGTKKFLSAADYSKLTGESGKISLDAIDKLTKSEAYKNMSNDEKIEAVADIYKYAKAIAANKTYGKELDGTTKLVKESGMEPGLYYAYKEMQSNFNASMENYEAFDQTFLAIKNDSSLSDKEKNSLYHNLLIKGNSESSWEKYTKISDKVTAEEYVDAMTQVKYIKGIGDEELEGDSGADKAKAEATEFSKYLDMMGYTGEKRAALEDTFGFYSMIRQDPQKYTFDMLKTDGNTYEKEAIGEVESSGMSATQYNQIKTLANRLQAGVDYEKGKTNAKKTAAAKIVSQNVDSYEQYAAVMSALGYKKFDSLYSGGGKLPEDKGASTGINVTRGGAQTSSAGFVNPTTASNSVVTSGYGGRNAPKTSGGYGSSNHDGIDIGGSGGSLDGQAADSIGGGKVVTVGWDPNGYGNYVEVDHGDGYTSLYGHLQKATVKQGDTINAGQQVGVIGSTGNSSGPHLHLRVRKDGKSIDPRTVIPGYGG